MAAPQSASLPKLLQSPVFTTTSGKGMFAGDHPLSLGCISRLGAVQEVFQQSDLLISFGARLTEFDTGRFGMQLPPQHIQVVEDARYPGIAFHQRRLWVKLARWRKRWARQHNACAVVRYRGNEREGSESPGSVGTG